MFIYKESIQKKGKTRIAVDWDKPVNKYKEHNLETGTLAWFIDR